MFTYKIVDFYKSKYNQELEYDSENFKKHAEWMLV